MEKEKLERELHGMVEHPIDRKYNDMLIKKLLPNFPIATDEITNINSMFGPDLVCVRGKKVRNKPSRVDMEEYVKISEYFYKLHMSVTLMADVMFVNGNAFMITSSRNIKLMTVDHILSKTANQISKSLNKFMKLYGRGDFIIPIVLMDMEFEKVAEIFVNVEVDIAVAREHVG